VAPTAETIGDASYPLSRSLYIYVNKAKAAANPAVVAYVDYYLADGTISSVLKTVPYVNLPADALAQTRSTWEATR
jgi:ABC-type phosphate transport system substrate-binding protein